MGKGFKGTKDKSIKKESKIKLDKTQLDRIEEKLDLLLSKKTNKK